LGKKGGMLGIIFRKAQNKIQDPAKLKRLIADLTDREKWSMLDADVKGNAYEGLLESRPMTACAVIRATGSAWCSPIRPSARSRA
jgi:hypothetical protein